MTAEEAEQMEQTVEELWGRMHDRVEPIAVEGRTYREQVARMLDTVTPELRRLYLVRTFEGMWGNGGLESCLMNDDDDLFIDETIEAFESLGGVELAQLLRELRPHAAARAGAIDAADERGEEFDFDDGFWEPWDRRWDVAMMKSPHYDVLAEDLKHHPEWYELHE